MHYLVLNIDLHIYTEMVKSTSILYISNKMLLKKPKRKIDPKIILNIKELLINICGVGSIIMTKIPF